MVVIDENVLIQWSFNINYCNRYARMFASFVAVKDLKLGIQLTLKYSRWKEKLN